MSTRYRVSANMLCLIIVFTVSTAIVVLNSCRQKTQLEQDIDDGQELAQHYCAACHQLPDPSQIDRRSWVKGVLPAMAQKLHLHSYGGEYYADRTSFITVADWQKIAAYYTNTAPEKLVIPKPAVAPLKDWAIFNAVRPKITDTTGPLAMTTYTGFNPTDHRIYSADAANNVYSWDADLNRKLVGTFSSPVTGALFPQNTDKSNTAIFTCIGVLPPMDIAKGKVIQISLDGKTKDTLTIGDGLPRAVQTVAADFNKDGLMDYVVCGFGHDIGGLYLLQQQKDHTFKKSSIRDIPGGEQLITGDFDGDGWPDVMCLFAQAQEGIWMFLNDHKGGFVTKDLLHFPAVYGSSSFQLVDFNHDGKPDILYTCGDNSDYSTLLKPYHGIYIFTNQGDWTFKQTYFYHADGCTKAIAADFDHDGDLDIAAISFFTDLKYNPQEGFLYMEQTKPGEFTIHELPVNKFGRWLTMDVADVDQDGNPDIILGNFSNIGRGFVNQRGFNPDWDKHEPIIVLKNMSGKKAAPVVSK